ncbi:TIGR04283 family arsenosugar biosynthesis glycosyltransferase [Sphingomonas sp. GCM10030256]|uniref:TIGR04283 family arsenosugar biosynthesis glycosyltransferase n=1 Tax=Sphingomonas sp. GCM10030256 TaxID=3273427 RepID=UPI00361A7CA2
MRISAIVPTLNAAAHLEPCLAALGGADEIIVTDGGSTDETLAIARGAGARVVSGPAGRGVQLAAGVAAAAHDGLLFVHADTRLSPGAVEHVRAHLARSARPACFALRLDDEAWQARLVESAVAVRTSLFRLPYGDQALAVRRAVYEQMGGFRPLPLMEDVDLIGRLPPVVMLPHEAHTSAERWRSDGWVHRSARNLLCLALWRAGVRPERIARLYPRPRRAARTPAHRAQPAE